MLTEFEPDQQVVHPHHGAGRIAGWEEAELGGETVRVLVVEFPRTTLMLRIPQAKVGASGLRGLASRAEMQSALAILPEPPVTLSGAWPRHVAACGQKLNSGKPVLLAGLVRDLNRPAGGAKGRSLYREALLRLTEELALVEGVPVDEAQAMIEAILPSAE